MTEQTMLTREEVLRKVALVKAGVVMKGTGLTYNQIYSVRSDTCRYITVKRLSDYFMKLKI